MRNAVLHVDRHQMYKKNYPFWKKFVVLRKKLKKNRLKLKRGILKYLTCSHCERNQVIKEKWEGEGWKPKIKSIWSRLISLNPPKWGGIGGVKQSVRPPPTLLSLVPCYEYFCILYLRSSLHPARDTTNILASNSFYWLKSAFLDT